MKSILVKSLLLFCSFSAIGVSAQTTTVSGSVLYVNEFAATEVEVRIQGTNFTQTTTVDSAGQYVFSEVPANQQFTVEVVKVESPNTPLNGVSTFDLVIATKHILGTQIFEEPEQYIAMDINQSGSNTAFDLIQLRQLILGLTTELPNSPSWQFIPTASLANANFEQSSTTNTIDAFASFTTTTTPVVVDFTAIKIGDANGNAVP